MTDPRGARPNILLIVADDLGYSDLGCFGGEMQTRHLDRLAYEGVRCPNFYNNAVCVPTRCSLLTGLYPQQVLPPGGGGVIPDNNVTLAELLGDAGYHTFGAGKWGLGHRADSLPVARGFDRFWGLLSGCSNYFNPGEQRGGEPAPAHKAPGDMRHWCDQGEVLLPFTPEDRDFYSTDAFSDKAIEFLDELGGADPAGDDGGRPFFLYLPECAPHFPLHAWPEDIERVGDRYAIGWDEVRRRRHRRLLDEGLLPPETPLSRRNPRVVAWGQEPDREARAYAMAVYAAMVERMDAAIGRVLTKIEELGRRDNTLVLFLSDNGACAEPIHNTPGVAPGPFDSYHTVDAGWANASNTPFRLFKVFDHEGGVATPLVASWPRMMAGGADDGIAGRIDHSVGHVLDLLPTFAELAGGEIPRERDGLRVLPHPGRSMAAQLTGQAPAREPADDGRVIYWETRGCRAVREGRWKLVSEGPPRQHVGVPVRTTGDHWELYDLHADRCEERDIVGTHPDVAARLEGRWQQWRRECVA